MEYYIGLVKGEILTIVTQLGWVAVAFGAAVVIAVLVMFGKNIRWKR